MLFFHTRNQINVRFYFVSKSELSQKKKTGENRENKMCAPHPLCVCDFEYS